MSQRVQTLTRPASHPELSPASAPHGSREAALAADAELSAQLRSLADHRAIELALAKLRRKKQQRPSTDPPS